jgi:tetratricopeptide (TPR) repeat protein
LIEKVMMLKLNCSVLRLVLLGTLLIGVQVSVASATTEELLRQADTAWAAGDVETAEARFKDAVAGAADGMAELRLGGFYLSQNRLADSVTSFQAALSAGLPDARLQSRAFLGLGIAYLHSGKSSLARAAFDEASRIDPARAAEIQPLLEELDKKEKPMGH